MRSVPGSSASDGHAAPRTGRACVSRRCRENSVAISTMTWLSRRDKVRAFVVETPDLTIPELWQKISALGIRVGRTAVCPVLAASAIDCKILDLRFHALPDEIIACHSSLGGEVGEWIAGC